MRVTVISATKQEFMGTVYYRCGHYYQRRGKRLHRTVWSHYYGDIPQGCHVHHKDDDRSNNNIENLECITCNEHLSGKHGHISSANGKRAIEIARVYASQWHKSEAGRAWHSIHGKEVWEKQQLRKITKICQWCGEEYETLVSKRNLSKWCGGNCKASALRCRRAMGL